MASDAAVVHAPWQDRQELWRHLRRGRQSDRVQVAVTERAGLISWAPFHMAVGIGIWFALPAQPSTLEYGVTLALLAIGLVLWFAPPDLPSYATLLRLGGFAAICIAIGFGLCGLRALRVEAPVLGFRYYGAIEGRVIRVDRSARDRIRLTLDRPRLERIAPGRIPETVRISLPAGATDAPPPGTHVMLTGHLGPPPGPAEPGGFDFRRSAWFASLGAIGYTRAPVTVAAPPEPGGALRLHRLRMQLSAAMQQRIGGQAGALAAALMTGDRSGIAEATNQMMRDSNLFHIISISGLHMGMLAGFVYAATRYAAVLFQCISRRGQSFPAHKLGAVVAILSAGAYLWLSGGGVATERAFLMVTVMLGAILADRRALSLRTVALAAVFILALAPEALLTPGFQMSFAATVALVVIYPPLQRRCRGLPWPIRPLVLLILTSLLAGMATSPIAAAHFSRMAHYGVLANLLVVPVTGALIMPMGPLAALLTPFGLEGPALWLMGLGTRWMLAVGEWIASLNGAVSFVIMPGPLVLPLMGGGAMMAVLGWRGDVPAWRNARIWAGGAMLLVSTALWLMTARPYVLISRQGDAVGIMTASGRALSKAKGGAFTVGEWLEKDGDLIAQADAAKRQGWSGPVKERRATLGSVEILHLTGKGSEEAAARECDLVDIIVSDREIAPLGGRCILLDLQALRKSGSVAIHHDDENLAWITAAEVAGKRRWTR
ncbi:ComEC/Rec2 family competence protein [Paracoccus albus]|uniref:ComEC/Rec2 family competence protein n=1 Tax=Paracoccus albus TaxID=3017784 RepID=UPI0022F106CE|nr:ComEC/Rec2 family competence protein [Paracoccus albus]WBU59206.1 ComEC/Rec2 family competence protein [Paracoccus albus]